MSLIKLAMMNKKAGEFSMMINGAASFARNMIGAKAAVPFAAQQAAHVAKLGNPLYKGLNTASKVLTGQKIYNLKNAGTQMLNKGLGGVDALGNKLNAFPKMKNFLVGAKDIALEGLGG